MLLILGPERYSNTQFPYLNSCRSAGKLRKVSWGIEGAEDFPRAKRFCGETAHK